MPFWQRLLITILLALAISFGAGLLWSALLQATMPSYLSGLVGGVAALPVWEFLKRVKPKRQP